MRLFKVNEKINLIGERKKTRNGFKHEATLLIHGIERDKTKVNYLNRTWERYEFETALKKLVNETKELSKDEKKECLNFLNGDLTDWTPFKTTGLIAGLGEVFATEKKDKNDWKKRMLKAGLKNKGLSFPEDWDNLSEDEKEKRLNLIINSIKEI